MPPGVNYGRRKPVAPQPEGEQFGLQDVNDQSFQGMQPPVRRQSPPDQGGQPSLDQAQLFGQPPQQGFQPLPPMGGTQELVTPNQEFGYEQGSGQMGGQTGSPPPDEILQLIMKLKGSMGGSQPPMSGFGG